MKIILLLITCMPFIILSDVAKHISKFPTKPPCPIGGYSVLQDSIKYPTISWKAGMAGVLWVSVVVDSEGTVVSVDFGQQDNVHIPFSSAVELGVRSVEWNPAYIGEKPIKAKVHFPLVFFLTHNPKEKRPMPSKGEIPRFHGSPVAIIHEVPIIL